jgi:DNA invertase Pin-like site-specific DNA recombinase
VESGKGSDAIDRRPKLAKALADARKRNAPIAVAKLDRLSRDVHFISGLMAHKVSFVVAEVSGGIGRRMASLPKQNLGLVRASSRR